MKFVCMYVCIYPCFSCGISKINSNVNSLSNASKRVDGDEKGNIGFNHCIVNPKHCTK